jgi:murein tripeptide amidase MpaA
MAAILMFVMVASVVSAAPQALQPLNGKRAFEGESVIRANLDTAVKRELVDRLNLDVWKEFPNGYADIRVNALEMDFFKTNNIEFEMYIEDVATLIEDAAERRRHYKGTRDVYFEEYHTYNEQVAYYNDLCSSSPKCSRRAVGNSYEGRTQYEYTIANNATSNLAIFMDAGIHSREWISSTTLQYVFTELLSSNNAAINRFTWIIHGHQNPDGYVYSWASSQNRLWRKSRNINSGSSCVGTDLNRNWPTPTWGGAGSSSSPCSDTYRGSGPGSEPETKNLIPRFLEAYKHYEVPVAISFHSYSQLLLRQWGHTSQNSPDETGQRNLGAEMVAAIRATHGLVYDNIKSIELYATTGTTGDWYYQNSTGTPTSIGQGTYGYTYEVRDTGRYGFELPENQIIPQGEEIWASIVAMAEYILDFKK